MTLPIARQADRSQIERIRPLVEGRACVVVGSAPLKTPKAEIEPGEVVIAVNGAISSLPGHADLWALNSKMQDRPGDPNLKPMHKTMLQQAKGRSAGHVLLLRGPKVASEQWTLETLRSLGCRYESWSVLDKTTKLDFEREQCGRKSEGRPCSAGVLTVASVLWCGAAHVRMVGFSFRPGYHYLPHVKPDYRWRDHLEADPRALKALSARYGSRLSGELVQAVVCAA